MVEHNLAKVGVASSSLVFRSRCEEKNGAVVQLVRILACHARGRGFESRPHRRRRSDVTSFFLFWLSVIVMTDVFNRLG